MWQFLSALGWLNILTWLFSRRAWWLWAGFGLTTLVYMVFPQLSPDAALWLLVASCGGLWLFTRRRQIAQAVRRHRGEQR